MRVAFYAVAQRVFALALGIAVLAVPLSASAQQANVSPRIAVILATSAPGSSPRLAAFQEGLRELGYVPGQNVVLEIHPWVGADTELADRAAAIVRAQPAVIVAEGNVVIATLKRATQAIPIVMAVVGDPVGSGFVASLARPGGNVTGLSNTAEQLSGKRVELLKDLVPRMTRVGVLKSPSNATHNALLRETEVAASALGITLLSFDFRDAKDLQSAFTAMAQAAIHAVVLLPQPSVIALRQQIVEAGRTRRLPMIFPSSEPVEAGGLIAYGPSANALWRRTTYYVDRILKGTRPSGLPIEQPTHFDLVLNAKAAQELGLSVPQHLRLLATRIVE